MNRNGEYINTAILYSGGQLLNTPRARNERTIRSTVSGAHAAALAMAPDADTRHLVGGVLVGAQ